MKKPFGMPGIGGSLGMCALCGKDFLLEILMNTTVKTLDIEGCENQLFAHAKCAKEFEGKTLQDLPDASPLKQATLKAK